MAGISQSTTTAMMANPGMRFVPNSELVAREKAIRGQDAPLILGMSQRLNLHWQAAKQAKEVVQRRMLCNLRQRLGVYEPAILDEIRAGGGSEIYMMLTNVKCRAAEAYLLNLMLSPGERVFSLTPSPMADLPPELDERAIDHVVQLAMQQFMQSGQVSKASLDEMLDGLRGKLVDRIQELAKTAAEKMGSKIDDQLLDGGWRDCVPGFVHDLVTFPGAIIKGPFSRRQRRMTWGDMANGYTPKIKEEIVQTFKRVSPLDGYPSPGARHIQQGYFIERMDLTVGDLNEMKGVPGYDDEAINSVIEEYGQGGLRQWLSYDNERARLEGRTTEYLNSNETIDALNYWGEITGAMLRQWDPHGKNINKDLDPHKSYQIEAWKIGRWVVKAQLNPHPLGRRPYSMTSYVKVPGSFWGQGIPELIADDQDMLNGAARSLDNNMGIASGPQVVINDVSRLPAGEPVVSLHPWQIWQFEQDAGLGASHRPPIEFFQPKALVAELLRVFDKFAQTADEHASLPSYIYGGNERVGGAGSTASGLSMLMGAANKNMQLVVFQIDMDVTENCVKGLYVHNMLHDPDPSIKGDNVVQARGASTLMAKEQKQIRLNEFMNVTNNEFDMSILGKKGRAFLLREAAKEMVDGEIPGLGDNLEEEEQQQPDPLEQQRLQVEQQRAQADQAKAANEAKTLELKGYEIDARAKIAADEQALKKVIEDAKIAAEKEIETMRLKSKEDEMLAKDNADMLTRLDAEAKDQKTKDEENSKQAKADAAAAKVEADKTVKADKEKAAQAHDSAQATSLTGVSKTLDEVTRSMKDLLDAQTGHEELATQVGTVAKAVSTLQTEAQDQGQQLDEAQKVRERIIAHLAKHGSPATQALVKKL